MNLEMIHVQVVEWTKIFLIAVKGLEPAAQPTLVLETRMLPRRQQDTCERQDL